MKYNTKIKIIILSFFCTVLLFAIFMPISEIEEKPKEVIIKIETEQKQEIPKKIIRDSTEIAREILKKEAAEILINKSKKYKIPLYVIYSIGEAESDFTEESDSKKGSEYGRGYFQVSDISLLEYNNYHSDKFTTDDMYTLENNAEVALWYFDRIYNHYLKGQGTYTDAYIAYNVGPTYFEEHKEELYNNIYKGEKYNALIRWRKILTKYYNIFNM